VSLDTLDEDMLMIRTLRLIDRLCVCFAQTSNDEDNPAARYSRQIKALQLKLSSLATNVSVLHWL
jgi:hypothetical protein